MSSSKIVFVTVHGGAGQHGRSSEAQVKDAMKRACTEAMRATSERPHPSALSIVETAITVLEDEDCLNAGYGSNLTFEGAVECDAAIMDALTGDFGSVGAVPGVKNPIRLARAVLERTRVPDRLGRIPPTTLVASGARVFAERHEIVTVEPGDLVSARAREEWRRWRARYDEANTSNTEAGVEVMQDTVGAIAWDSEGNLAAGVSSGGLLLKYEGRIGEAATFGAGCWAEQSDDGRSGMACSISGAGEHIMRTALARTLADVLARPARRGQQGHQESGAEVNAEVDVHDALAHTLSAQFYNPISARGETRPNAGILLMTKDTCESGDVIPRLWCAFTTESMAIAYANSDTLTPKAKILRRPESSHTTDASHVYITALPLNG